MRTAQDYTQRAKAIAAAFCAGEEVGGNDLASLVEKAAREERLNPEQIRRLGRAANTETFGAKYAAMRGQAHRRVDFTPVDPEVVIEKLQLSDGMPTAKLAGTAYPDLPDPRRAARAIEKTAAVASAAPARVSRADLAARRADAVKIAKDLAYEVEGLNIRWRDAVAKAVGLCKAASHDHVEFEKAAVAAVGEDVLPELNAVRAELRLPPLPATREKLAAVRDHLLARETPATRLLKTAVELRTAYGKARETFEKAVALRDALTEELRRG